MVERASMRTFNILMVEDNSDDIRLTWEAFREAGVPVQLYFVPDGTELFRYLHRHGKYRSAPRPDLILLDLHLAMTEGHEILAAVKRDPEFTCIPVVILTTSDDEKDIDRAYQLRANCFVTKPVELDQFRHVVREISTFWFATATLPTRMVHAHT